MGVGHVPPGKVSAAGAGPELPRRQHRRAGAERPALTPAGVGLVGERLAGRFAFELGASTIERNQRRGRNELDLVVELGGRRVAVEVKTSTIDLDHAVDRFDEAKRHLVNEIASGASRTDLVAVLLTRRGYYLRWMVDVG